MKYFDGVKMQLLPAVVKSFDESADFSVSFNCVWEVVQSANSHRLINTQSLIKLTTEIATRPHLATENITVKVTTAVAADTPTRTLAVVNRAMLSLKKTKCKSSCTAANAI